MVDAPRRLPSSIDDIPVVVDFRRRVDRERLADWKDLLDKVDRQKYKITPRQELRRRQLEHLPAGEELILAVLWGEKQAGSASLIEFETKASILTKTSILALRAATLRKEFISVGGSWFDRQDYYRSMYWLRDKKLLLVRYLKGKGWHVWTHPKAPICYQEAVGSYSVANSLKNK